jgi:hypothetical protein
VKNITKLIVIVAIVFLVAGIIAFFLGNITFNSYGTILLYCGLGLMAISVFIEFGSKRGTMSDRWSSGRFGSQQQSREMKDLQTSSKSSLYLFLLGIIPVVTGYLLMHLF